MREGAQKAEKRQQSHNIFGEYTHQMRIYSIRVHTKSLYTQTHVMYILFYAYRQRFVYIMHINIYNFIRTFVRTLIRSLRIANFRGKSTHLMWEESKHWLQFPCVSVLSVNILLVEVLVCLLVRFFFGCVVLIVSSQRHTRFRNILGLGTRSYATPRLLYFIIAAAVVCVCVCVHRYLSTLLRVQHFLCRYFWYGRRA